MSFQQQYDNFLNRRHPWISATPEQSYSCLCCRDNGVLPVDVIKRYLEDEETELMGVMATPIRCNRTGCKGGVVRDEEGRTFPRYAEYATRNDLAAAACQNIHQWELERMRELGVNRPDADNAATIAQQVHQVAVQKSMQRESVVDIPSVDAPVPAFRVGDRVRFTAEKFESKSERKQVIQELGEFFGSEGEVVRSEWVPMLRHYRYHVQVGDRVAKYTEVYMAAVLEVAA